MVESSFGFEFCDSDEAWGNEYFEVRGNELVIAKELDYDNVAEYSICMRVTNGDLNSDVMFGIDIHYIPEQPTAVHLSSNYVYENAPIGSLVGELSTVDPDQNDFFTYALVDTLYYPYNEKFTIQGNQLKTNFIFDYEETENCIVKLETKDGANHTYDATFEINILDQYDTSNILLDNSYLQWDV